MRGLEVQLDSGTTHLALPATLHDQLLPAATRPASLALSLRDGRMHNAVHNAVDNAVHNHTPVRPPLAPPPGALQLHAPASMPAVALLLPLSHGCRAKEGESSAASGAASSAAACLTCLRSTAAPVLARSTQLILGLPFLLHYDVSFYRRAGGSDTLAVSVSRSRRRSSSSGRRCNNPAAGAPPSTTTSTSTSSGTPLTAAVGPRKLVRRSRNCEVVF